MPKKRPYVGFTSFGFREIVTLAHVARTWLEATRRSRQPSEFHAVGFNQYLEVREQLYVKLEVGCGYN